MNLDTTEAPPARQPMPAPVQPQPLLSTSPVPVKKPKRHGWQFWVSLVVLLLLGLVIVVGMLGTLIVC